MILNVGFDQATFKKSPHRFEAGTPDISGPIALGAAMDYLDEIGRDAILAHDQELVARAYEGLSRLNGIRLFGPREKRGAVLSFLLDDVHAHDVVTVADQLGVALRGGHHCTQPLMRKLGVESTARASFYFYNTAEDVDRAGQMVQAVPGVVCRRPVLAPGCPLMARKAGPSSPAMVVDRDCCVCLDQNWPDTSHG